MILNLGTYPPKQCGIATFSMDLRNSLIRNKNQVKIMAISDDKFEYNYPSEVVFNIRQEEKQDYARAASYVNSFSEIEIVIIQHEYGIFGGSHGENILHFAAKLKKPYIVVCHTVLPRPRRQQKSILKNLCARSSAVICMTKRSARLLINLYGVEEKLVNVISHGVPEFKKRPAKELKIKHNLCGKKVISTFGLIGPGKGLELAIKAMPEVIKDFPEAIYLILGQTHPMLKEKEGESYRTMLERMVQDLNMENNIQFINRFLTDEELGEYLNMSDIYLSPYPNKDQAVSGTMAFALGCGKAIVSTSYAYAIEVLQNGRGLLAETANPKLLSQLIKEILADPALQKKLEANAYEIGKTWAWPSIGKQYSSLIADLLDEAYSQEEQKLNYVGL